MELSENQQIETTNEEQQKENNHSKSFYTNKWFYINLFIALLVIVGFTLYFLSLPFKSEDVCCKYKSKYNKIECVQTGDIVPNWLNLDNVDFLNYLGLGTNYSMKIIFEHNKKDSINGVLVCSVYSFKPCSCIKVIIFITPSCNTHGLNIIYTVVRKP